MQGYYYEGKSSKPSIVVYVKYKDIVTKENHQSLQSHCFEYLRFH